MSQDNGLSLEFKSKKEALHFFIELLDRLCIEGDEKSSAKIFNNNYTIGTAGEIIWGERRRMDASPGMTLYFANKKEAMRYFIMVIDNICTFGGEKSGGSKFFNPNLGITEDMCNEFGLEVRWGR